MSEILLGAIIISQIAMWSLFGIIGYFFMKNSQTINTGEGATAVEDGLNEFAKYLEESLKDSFDVDKLKAEVSNSVVVSMKKEIDTIVLDPDVQKQISEFVTAIVSNVLRTELPEILPPVIGQMFGQNVEGTAEGQPAAQGQPMQGMNLANTSTEDIIKMMLLQFAQNMMPKQQVSGGNQQALPASSLSQW